LEKKIKNIISQILLTKRVRRKTISSDLQARMRELIGIPFEYYIEKETVIIFTENHSLYSDLCLKKIAIEKLLKKEIKEPFKIKFIIKR